MAAREDRFRTIFDTAYQPLHAFARRRLAPSEVDDLVADVLTVAWRRLDDIPEGAELPWLYGVAHRTLANHRRSTDRRRRLVQRIGTQPTAVGTTPDLPAVREALASLRPDDQDLLRLAAWEDLTSSQIALVLGCSTNAAALRLSRARARLREAMTAQQRLRTREPRSVTDG